MDRSIVFYTDNSVDTSLLNRVIEHLKETAGDIPIVSVSHEPIYLGHNIVIGKKKRSWLTLYRQLLTGLKEINTRYVMTAEHDCFYTREHMEWTPPRDDTFYYNESNYLVQWADDHPKLKGMYSVYWEERLALSQLVCNTELLRETIDARLDILDKNRSLVKAIQHIGEPGNSKVLKVRQLAASGRPVYLREYLKKQLDKEKLGTFRTKLYNLDVRHNHNFTGPKRGRKRVFEVPYWGRFEEFMNENKQNA